MQRGCCVAWFSSVDGTKVTSLKPQAIDAMHMVHPNWQILVEADGAKEKWVKAPKTTEPIIPSQTTTTIGVVNLQMLGTELTEEHVHNLGAAANIMERAKGAVVTSSMLARLVLHPQGLFQYSQGKRILFCTGYDTVQHRIIDAFLDALSDSKFSMIVLADGYKASCEIARVIQWQ